MDYMYMGHDTILVHGIINQKTMMWIYKINEDLRPYVLIPFVSSNRFWDVPMLFVPAAILEPPFTYIHRNYVSIILEFLYFKLATTEKQPM